MVLPEGMATSSPVRGLRPTPRLRGLTTKTPKPRSSMRSPRARASFIEWKRASTACSAFIFGTPVRSATRFTMSSLITALRPPLPCPRDIAGEDLSKGNNSLRRDNRDAARGLSRFDNGGGRRLTSVGGGRALDRRTAYAPIRQEGPARARVRRRAGGRRPRRRGAAPARRVADALLGRGASALPRPRLRADDNGARARLRRAAREGRGHFDAAAPARRRAHLRQQAHLLRPARGRARRHSRLLVPRRPLEELHQARHRAPRRDRADARGENLRQRQGTQRALPRPG